jgi:hypothetical protein
MSEAFESGRRRAEIDGQVVSFLRVTGHIRKSVSCVWWIECDDIRYARRLALRWVRGKKLGKIVVPKAA